MENDLSSAEKDTILAKKRTIYSAVRTLLAYIKTSAVMISLAFAFMKLDKDDPIDALTITLFCLSAFFLILGFIDYFVSKKAIENL